MDPASAPGLCATCNHRLGCMHLAAATTPVWRCSLFDDTAIPGEASAGAPPARPTAASLDVQGICANCEQLRTCQLPKAPTGVWHCEQYR